MRTRDIVDGGDGKIHSNYKFEPWYLNFNDRKIK